MNELPDEIMLNIFQYLDGRSLDSARQVCSHWNRVAEDKKLPPASTIRRSVEILLRAEEVIVPGYDPGPAMRDRHYSLINKEKNWRACRNFFALITIPMVAGCVVVSCLIMKGLNTQRKNLRLFAKMATGFGCLWVGSHLYVRHLEMMLQLQQRLGVDRIRFSEHATDDLGQVKLFRRTTHRQMAQYLRLRSLVDRHPTWMQDPEKMLCLNVLHDIAKWRDDPKSDWTTDISLATSSTPSVGTYFNPAADPLNSLEPLLAWMQTWA